MLSFSSPTWQASLHSPTENSGERSALGPAGSLILPRLYLSNYFFAHKAERLQTEGITHVVSILEQTPVYPPFLKGTLHISLADSFQADILQHLDATTQFIKSALAESSENKVLVHCLMGISRSATVVCAYLVATTPMTANETIDFVRAKRPIACPNIGFRKQLDTYSMQFYRKGLAAKGRARIAGVSESISARIKKLKGMNNDEGTQVVAEKTIASVVVTASSVQSTGEDNPTS